MKNTFPLRLIRSSTKLSRPHIVLANFTTEKNKGDAALQISLIRMIRENFADARITVCSFFGANQNGLAKAETIYSVRENIDDLVGGLQPSYIETETAPHRTGTFADILLKFRNVGGIVFSIFLLLWLIIGVPRRFISYCLPSAFKPTFKAFQEADLIVIKGSNLREPSISRGPLYTFWVLYHALVGLFMQKPVAFIGGSIWPLRNPISILLARFVFERSFVITLRESISYKTLRKTLKIRNKNVCVLPDLSFYLLGQLGPEIVNANIKYQNSKPTIGITVVDWRDQGEVARQNYIKSLRNLIMYASKRYGAQFIVIPQVTFTLENTDNILNEIIEGECSSHVKIVKSELSIEALLNAYAKLDFLVATRLHSAVFAISVGVPVLAITYEGGAKARGILTTMGLEGTVLEYGVDSSVLIKQFEALWNNRELLSAKAIKNLPRLYEEVNKNILILKELLTQANIKN